MASGGRLTPAETKKLQRGDLIFWKGHVAIVRDADTIVHANAHHMATVIENTREAIARIKAAGSEVTAIKRLIDRSLHVIPRQREARCAGASDRRNPSMLEPRRGSLRSDSQ